MKLLLPFTFNKVIIMKNQKGKIYLMNNRRKYKRNFKYRYQKNEMTLDVIIDNYNEILKNQSKTNFFFWYKMSIPIVIAFNIIDLLGLASFGLLNFLTGISGVVGAVFILYSVFKNDISKTDLTKKLIIPSFVIFFCPFQ